MLSAEYLNNPRMSQSKLKVILDGVDEFRYQIDHPFEKTDAQNLGSAVHILLLQPHLADIIIAKPKFASNTRQGKIFNLLREGKGLNFFPISDKKVKKQEEDLFYEVDLEERAFIINSLDKYKEFFKSQENSLILSEDDYKKAYEMALNVRKNMHAKQILDSCTQFEKTIFFDHENIEFKAQLDGFGKNFILDLKTTSIKNKDYLIRKEIRDRRYHFQAVSYLNAYRSIYSISESISYYIIFVRNEPPYTVFPVQLSSELIAEGIEQFHMACELYKDCLENNPHFLARNHLKLI